MTKTAKNKPSWHACEKNTVSVYDCPDCRREVEAEVAQEDEPTAAQERRASKLIRDLEAVQFASDSERDERRVAAREANALRAALPAHNGQATRSGLASAILRAEEVAEGWGWS